MRKTLLIVAGLSLVAVPFAGAAGSEAQWDASPNQTWASLRPQLKKELVQDERDWISWKEKLPSEARYNAVMNRALYLQALVAGDHPDAIQGWNVRRNFDRPTGKVSPAEAQQTLDRDLQQFQHQAQEVRELRKKLIASAKFVKEDYLLGYRYYQSLVDEAVGYHPGDRTTISEMAIPGLIDEGLLKFKDKLTSLGSFEQGFRHAVIDFSVTGGPATYPAVGGNKDGQ